MKILFIGIFDHNEPNTGFRNAFRKVSEQYTEIAWSNSSKDSLNNEVIKSIASKTHDLIFMQLQAPNVINKSCLQAMKASGAYLCQWTGDARQPLPQHYIEFGSEIDLSLFSNESDADVLTQAGVKADFLPSACDHEIYKPLGNKIDVVPQIVFMGNNYPNVFDLSDYRYDMVQFLKNTYTINFGLYGTNWPKKWGIKSLMYKQQDEAAIYRSCKIGINLSHYDLKKYASDRLFRIMGSGAMCITKQFPGMDEFGSGKNFVAFDGDFTQLRSKIDYYLTHEAERKKIAVAGCKYTHKSCTWDHRIQELLRLIDKHKKNELGKAVA